MPLKHSSPNRHPPTTNRKAPERAVAPEQALNRGSRYWDVVANPELGCSMQSRVQVPRLVGHAKGCRGET